MTTCPWSGSECDCTAFPYLVSNLVPAACEDRIVNGSITLTPLRKVTEATKTAYKKWMIEEEIRRKNERSAQNTA